MRVREELCNPCTYCMPALCGLLRQAVLTQGQPCELQTPRPLYLLAQYVPVFSMSGGLRGQMPQSEKKWP